MFYELLIVAVLIVILALSHDTQCLVVICFANFSVYFLWAIPGLSLPLYSAIQHGALYWTYSDLCEALHLLFWLCLRWIAFMFWFCSPASPVIFTLDPPAEH